MTKQYCTIIFMHDYEDDSGMVEKFFNNEVAVVDLFAYLAQWDNGDDSEVSDSPPWGAGDTIEAFEDYILAYNSILSYVSLTRVTNAEAQESVVSRSINLTRWEAVQGAAMIKYCQEAMKPIDSDYGAISQEAYDAKTSVLIDKLKTFAKGFD